MRCSPSKRQSKREATISLFSGISVSIKRIIIQLLPRIRTKFGENIGVELFISHPDLETEETFIATDASSGVSSLTIDNGLKFANAEYVIIGRFGYEKAEILKINGTPTTTSISFTSATNHPHNRGERIQFIPYNQLVIEYSTDGTTYNALSAIDIRPGATETYIQRTSDPATYYYKVRFYNATTTLYSQYSDGMIATGDVEDSAGAIIRNALISMGEKIDDEVLTKEFLLLALDEGRDEIDLHQNVIKWSFRTQFDYDAGDVIPGRNKLTLPTDLRDPDTAKNILSIRIGRDALPLDYLDKREMNRYYQGVAHSTLNGAILSGATSIILVSSGDFAESGAISIAAESISETIDESDYTTNTETTATLGTVTNVDVNHATGRDVWQGISFGTPYLYTVNDGEIIFNQPFSNDIAGENIWLDYYKKKTVLNSFGDTFDEPFYKIYVPYVKFRIKLRKNPSLAIQTDPDYLMWAQKRDAQILKEFTGQDARLIIDIP